MSVCFSKLGILFTYEDLIPISAMIIPGRCIATFITLWNLSGIIAGFAICRPLAMHWDPTIPGGMCGDVKTWYASMGAINIATDFFVIGLPLPFLYKLKMPLGKRIGLMGIFALGFM